MTEPKITYVLFTKPQPRPKSPRRAYGNSKELALKDVPGGFRAGAHGISYRHQTLGRILVPWSGVIHCHAEEPIAKAQPEDNGGLPKKRRGRPPKAKPPAAST